MPRRSSDSRPLQGKWIVITRPAHQATKLQEKLESAGANIILFPLLEISSPQDTRLVQKLFEKIDRHDLLIFISPNAVWQSLKWLDKDTLNDMKIAAVGKKTADALTQSGMHPDLFPEKQFNSEALLAMPELQQLVNTNQARRIAIIRGENGRDKLRNTLTERGAQVEYINVYQRSCPQKNTHVLKQHYHRGELDIILLTSGASLSYLLRLSNNEPWLNQVTLLLGSRRMLQQLPEDFHGHVIVAEDPSDETLYEKLIA